jgi:hypothetical protein
VLAVVFSSLGSRTGGTKKSFLPKPLDCWAQLSAGRCMGTLTGSRPGAGRQRMAPEGVSEGPLPTGRSTLEAKLPFHWP